MSRLETTDIWRLGVLEIAQAVRHKEISCREVIQAHLRRIEAVNPKVNAITVVLREEALRLAEEADQKLAQGVEVGPLCGVPMTIKENIGTLTPIDPMFIKE